VFLTGAGVSTGSGIPDYRSPGGLYSRGHRPMTIQQFMSGPEQQRRYFARSFVGYGPMERARPNPSHIAIARLIDGGVAQRVVTQNVDGLHHAAFASIRGDAVGDGLPSWSRSDPRLASVVTELHGSVMRVRCLSCNTVTPRADWQRRLATANAAWIEEVAARYPSADFDRLREICNEEASTGTTRLKPGSDLGAKQTAARWARPPRVTPSPASQSPPHSADDRERPDGDFLLQEEDALRFTLPACPDCAMGIIRPDVVFFGDSIPRPIVAEAAAAVEGAACLICVGSSLEVPSAFRLVRAARDGGIPVAVINKGPTRADADGIALRVELPAEEILPLAADILLASSPL
jgi:NAD-dependent SIR2 family protein deacetylase